MPVYNNEKYLPACIESILMQSFSDFELICVDDGSQDKSLQIIERYAQKDKRIMVISQENQGVGSARNRAMQVAKGEWFAFCDGDDIVPKHAYRDLYRKSSDRDVVIGEYMEIDDMGKKLYLKCRRKHQNSTFYAMFMSPCVWNKLIRRSFIQKANISFSKLMLGEDVVFLGEIAKLQPKVYIVKKCCYQHYNRYQAETVSLTHKYDLEHFKEYIRCRDILLDICWRQGNILEAYDHVCYEMMIPLLECIFRIQDFAEKEKCFELMKTFLKQFYWEREPEHFLQLFGMHYDNFSKINAYDYFTSTKIFDHAEIVLKQYEAGAMGASYIVKYTKAWTKYKLKKSLFNFMYRLKIKKNGA